MQLASGGRRWDHMSSCAAYRSNLGVAGAGGGHRAALEPHACGMDAVEDSVAGGPVYAREQRGCQVLGSKIPGDTLRCA